mgnify:CR=1 FL=1
MWLYPMHELEKQTKEKRAAIREFIFYFVREYLPFQPVPDGEQEEQALERLLDKFLGIDRVKYAEEEAQMEKVRKNNDERAARGEKAGSRIPGKKGS